MDVDSMYQDIILDHYRNPQGRGLREPFDAEVHHINPTCGDEITLRVRLGDEGRTLADLSYEGQGCSISQASASVLHDLVAGTSVADAMRSEAAFRELMHSKGQGTPDEEALGDAVAFQGTAKYPSRVKCALLAWMALTDALARAGARADSPDKETP